MAERDTIIELHKQDDTLFERRGDRYVYFHATENQDPLFATEARQIHALSYLGEGFIHEEAIGADGQIIPSVDKARGDNVVYYIGRDSGCDDAPGVSTLRKVLVPPKGDYTALPGYALSESVLSDEGHSTLQLAHEEGRPIIEISSFGHIPEVMAPAGLELLRNVLQESYGTGEVWFFSMVTNKYKTLQGLFGPHAVRQVGAPVAIDDERVDAGVTLTPAIVDTTTFFDDIAKSVFDESLDARLRNRYVTYLRNFAKGIPRNKLSGDVQLLLEDSPTFGFSAYVQSKQDTLSSKRWSEPLELQLSSRADLLYARRLVEDGAVRHVVNPAWNEEFPEGVGAPIADSEGAWFYYPWNQSLVHFPDHDTYSHLRHLRDRSLIRPDEAERLQEARPLVAGLSVGSHVAEHLAYAGVGGTIALADFDTLSISNLNRFHAGMSHVGEPKLDVVAKKVSELDPYITQIHLRQGVTSEALEALSGVTIIFDEVDDFTAKALLRQYARQKKIPLIMATDVGYRSLVDVERHDLEEVQPFNGRVSEDDFEYMLAGKFSQSESKTVQKERARITRRIVGLANASSRLIESMNSDEIHWHPQLGVTASQGGALATIVAQDILLGRDVWSGRRVHDARRAMKLYGQDSSLAMIKGLRQFLSKR